MYVIEIRIPVMSWRVRAIPDRNPMFHSREIELGVGRSFSELESIFNMGFCLVSWFFIRRWKRLFGGGGERGGKL